MNHHHRCTGSPGKTFDNDVSLGRVMLAVAVAVPVGTWSGVLNMVGDD